MYNLKSAASKLGIPLSEYLWQISQGFKWCWGHRRWERRSEFYSRDLKYAKTMPCKVWQRASALARVPRRKERHEAA